VTERASQSRAGSLAEATANVLAGYVLALVIQALAYPAFGIATTITTDLAIAALFTAGSLVRSYVVRRLFEALLRSGGEAASHARP
jgi:hypothetical protein